MKLFFTELYKNFLNADTEAPVYFWQDYSKKEIDFMLDRGQSLFPIEAKFGQTINSSYFKNIESWLALTGNTQDSGSIIYGGDQWQNRKNIQLIPWYGVS